MVLKLCQAKCFMMKNVGKTNSVLASLLSDCCGNIQNVVDNACNDLEDENPPSIIVEEKVVLPPSNSNLNEYYTQVNDIDEFRSSLIRFFGTEFMYDLSPDSIPHIHPAEEAEIIEAANLANRRQIYYSCYLPSTYEKENVKSIMGQWNLSAEAKNSNTVDIVGRNPKGTKMNQSNLASILQETIPDQPGLVFIKGGTIMVQKMESKSLNIKTQSMKCNYHDLALFNRFIFISASVSCNKALNGDIVEGRNNGHTKELSFKKKVGHMLWKRELTMEKMHTIIPIMSITKIIDLGLSPPSEQLSEVVINNAEKTQGKNNDISNLEDSGIESIHDSLFQIDIDNGSSLNFFCSSPLQKNLWLHLLRNTLVGAWCREYKMKLNSSNKDDIGWQHHIVITNIYAVCCCGDIQMLQHILDNPDYDKFKLGLPDTIGYTAIHYCVLKNQIPCLELLLEHGLDPNIKDKNMLSAADHAKMLSNTKALTILESYQCVPSLRIETANDHKDVLKTKKTIYLKEKMERKGRLLEEMKGKSFQLQNVCAENRFLRYQTASFKKRK